MLLRVILNSLCTPDDQYIWASVTLYLDIVCLPLLLLLLLLVVSALLRACLPPSGVPAFHQSCICTRP